ncbi:Segregation and condensation protein A [hydrothermal vent metagenome]|uniref:Segregation and condensation protein A n=1 Tax=hydrothermal vent metagenome TaxID=652676 RepID=A0A3B1C2G0_9ZZZZ
MAYNIKLDVFEGPLDLLLHLIKENEVEIYDIPIARITGQYFEYLDLMKNINLELAGDFLVMASTLTYIKSKMLLPVHEDDIEEDELGVDPRDELVRKLVEYKKFKEASYKLREREMTQSQIFARRPNAEDGPDDSELLLEVSVFELIKSFNSALERMGGGEEYTVTIEEISVTDKLSEMMSRFEEEESMTFDSLFDNDKSKMQIIATFLALLEVLRLKVARAHQSKPGGEIIIYRAPDFSTGDEKTGEAGAEDDIDLNNDTNNETKPDSMEQDEG